MKRYLLIVLAVILLSCFLISCNPEAEDVKRIDPAIVGTWTCTEEKSPVATYTWNLTLKNDGTYIMEELYNGDPSQTDTGKCWNEGNKWVCTFTNLEDFFPYYKPYTSEHPCYVFRDADETHWKLGFSEKCENPLDYDNTYDWDDEKKIYYIEQNDAERHEYWYHKFGDASYEFSSTGITKDESDNEMYRMEIVFIAKAEAYTDPSANKVFEKFYDFDTGKCSCKVTSSYKKDGDTLTLYWQGSEKTFTKK